MSIMLFFLGILVFLLQMFTTFAVLSPDPYIRYSQLSLSSSRTLGPDSVLLDRNNQGPYVAAEDGRILKYNGNDFVDFAYISPNRTKELCDGTTNKDLGSTCGRVLGLTYDRSTGNIYAVGAYGGLYRIGPNGGLATKLAENPTFLAGVDMDPFRNVLYYTIASLTFSYRKVVDGFLIPPEDSTGKLLKYDIPSGVVTVLSENLPGPGGPATCPDGTCILYSSINTNKVFKYFLVGPKAGTTEPLLQLPGYPVKIKRAATPGLLWVAVNVVVSAQPRVVHGFGYRFNQFGQVNLIKDFAKEFPGLQVNVVQEYNTLLGAKIYVGSRPANYVGIYRTLL